MFSTEQMKLLQPRLRDVPQVVMESTLKHDIDALVHTALPARNVAVVFDENTKRAMGEQIVRALKNSKPLLLEGDVTADDETVAFIQRSTLDCDALVAVGSGTVGDLCKYAAFLDKKPYGMFATAASMNGYLSANASITVKGHKTTLAAAMPRAVWCDLSVIAEAPVRLHKSGLGDSLARSTAQADWLLSHLLLGTAYDKAPFELLASVEPELYERASGLTKSDRESIKLLMQTLLLSGLGMTMAGGSYPASQGEHMIAHTYGMILHPKPHTFHGEEIGVTTLAMARRQEMLLTEKVVFAPDTFKKEHMVGMFGQDVAEKAQKTFAGKMEQIEKHRDALSNWADIAHHIEPIIMGSDKIQSILEAAQAPTAAAQLGWHMQLYIEASRCARFMRDRFTFLDLE